MLEENFTPLDDDFITLWSKYIVSNENYHEISCELEKLAELGQINAIQSWYLFNKPGVNDMIDKNCKGLGSDSNSLWAKANYEWLAFNEWIEDYETLTKKVNYQGEFFEAIKEKPLIPAGVINQTEYVRKVFQAIRAGETEYQETQNPLTLQRYLEMVASKPFEPTLKEKRETKNCALQLRKELYNLFWQNPIPQIEFALGKNLYYFDGNKKTKQEGLQLLTDLSDRGYSKDLLDYSTKGKQIKRKNDDDDDDFIGPIYPISPERYGLS